MSVGPQPSEAVRRVEETLDFSAAVIVMGTDRVDPVLETLQSLAAVLDQLPHTRTRLVIAADAHVLDGLPLQPAEDLITLPCDGLDQDEALLHAVRSAGADQHVVIRAGAPALASHAALLAAKLGTVPHGSRGPKHPGESLGDRLNGLGLQLMGRLELDDATVIEAPVCLSVGMVNLRPTRIGAFTYSSSFIPGAVASVGRYCSIAHAVEFGASEHPTTYLSTSPFQYNGGHQWEAHLARAGAVHCDRPREMTTNHPSITIGNDVWIGTGAYIRGGVTLGDGCIVGANAVVTRDVPPYAIVVGNPGRVVKHRFEPDVVERLLELAWWQYDCADFDGIDAADVEQSIDRLIELRDAGLLRPYRSFSQPFGELLGSLGF